MKNLSFALAIGLGLLTGCHGGPPQPQIGIAFGSFDDPDVRRIRSALVSVSGSHSDLVVVDSGNQQALQSSQIDELLSRRIKAMAVNLVIGEAAGLVIDKAKEAIVPLVLFGGEVGADDMKKWDKVYYVGARREQGGSVQGRILADWWKANPGADRNHDGKIQYLLLGGDPDEEASLAQSFESALSEAGLSAVLLASDPAEGRSAGNAAMARLFAKYGRSFEAVACRDDAEALGAIDALRARGYFSGKKFLPVLGIGATPPALDSLAAGMLLGTAWSDAEGQAKAILDLTRALASGTPPSRTGWPLTDGKYVWVPYRMVSAKNFAEFGR